MLSRQRAVNQLPDELLQIEDSESAEAHEQRLSCLYESAISSAARGDVDLARQMLNELLQDPYLTLGEVHSDQDCRSTLPVSSFAAPKKQQQAGKATKTSRILAQLRHLALLNLGLLREGDASTEEVELLLRASEGLPAASKGSATQLWHQLADSSFLRGRHGIARHALEKGLSHCPNHPVMAEKLMQLCWYNGEREESVSIASHLMLWSACDSAREVLSLSTPMEEEQEEEEDSSSSWPAAKRLCLSMAHEETGADCLSMDLETVVEDLPGGGRGVSHHQHTLEVKDLDALIMYLSIHNAAPSSVQIIFQARGPNERLSPQGEPHPLCHLPSFTPIPQAQ